MKTEASKQALATTPTINWSDEVVLPRFGVPIEQDDIDTCGPTAGLMSTEDWQSVDEEGVADACRDDPCSVIRRLLVGRLQPPPCETESEGDRLPVVSAAEALELVGVGSPTPLQIQVCASTLLGLFGRPKKYHGRDRWLVFLRSDDSALSKRLARKYPLPAFHDFLRERWN